MPKKKLVVKQPKVKTVKNKADTYLIECDGSMCLGKAFAAQIVHEALASTVWEPSTEKGIGREFLVVDVAVVPLKHGHQTFGVTVRNLNGKFEEKEDILLHEFFKLFNPVRQVNVQEYQA
jgi:hypothetical protein